MAQVDSSVTIDAPREIVWELAQDVSRFPEIMPDLDEVKVLESETVSATTRRVVSDWHGRIKKFNRKMNWTEEDIWNTDDYTCHFWQLKGDFNEYSGVWKFEEKGPNQTVMVLNLTYRFEIPLVGALMQKVVQNLLQENADNMLSALKKESEKRAGKAS
jgi:ribosome-associated toxin RatA of RatAB toxin-antitoxin module